MGATIEKNRYILKRNLAKLVPLSRKDIESQQFSEYSAYSIMHLQKFSKKWSLQNIKMKPDKDKPWTWLSYKPGMCQGCLGSCCTMPVEVCGTDLVRLGLTTKDELEESPRRLTKRLIKDGVLQSYRQGTQLFMLASRANGDCVFLHPMTRLCQKYELRPSVCREFPKIGPRPGFCPCIKNSA